MRKLIIASWFVVFVINAQAQFVPVPQTFNTPMGPIHTTHYVYMPHNYGNGSGSPKYKFKVTLNNDSTFSFKSKMLAEKKKMYVEYKANGIKRKLFPSDTKSISGFESLNPEKKGFAADSCWLFLIIDGAINCYSSVPGTYYQLTIAIQKGKDAEIVPLTKDRLAEMVSDMTDEKLRKALEKGKLADVLNRYNTLREQEAKK